MMQMFVGGNKPQKIQKTKFRKNAESERYSSKQHKHHDKSTYRLLKQEEEYEFENRITKRN